MKKAAKHLLSLSLALILLLALMPGNAFAVDAPEGGQLMPPVLPAPVLEDPASDHQPPGTTPRPSSGGFLKRGISAITPEAQSISDQILQNFLQMPPRMFLWNSDFFLASRYRYEENDDLGYTEAMRDALISVAQTITASCKTDAERIEAIAYWVAENVCYDHDFFTHGTKSYPDIDPYTVLERQYTVCAGYANTCEYLLQGLNIPCIVAGAPDHAFNFAYDGSRWVIFDSTWMSPCIYEYGKLNNIGSPAYSGWFDVSYEADIRTQENHVLQGTAYTVYDGKIAEFPKYTKLTEFSFGREINAVGNWVFSGTALETVRFGSDTLTFGDCAFYQCGNLTSVTFPGSVTSVGECAFLACGNLAGDIALTGVRNIGPWAFSGSGLTSVSIYGDSAVIGESAFYDCDSLEYLTIQGSISEIGSYAFGSCDGMFGDITLTGISNIGQWAFFGSGLTGVFIYGDSAVIGESAFYDCVDLNSVTLQGTVTVIDKYAFAWTGFESIELPYGVENIGSFAFYVCDKLTSVSIPQSVSVIGESVFEFTALTDVYYGGSSSAWDNISIGPNNERLTNAAMHYGLSFNSVTADKSSAAWGDEITWTASVFGGNGSLKYKFDVYKDGSLVKTGSYQSNRIYRYTPLEAGTYHVIVTVKDADGNTASRSGDSVTVAAALSIITQPKNYVGAVGSTATATVKATGEGLTYQWYFANPGAASFTKSGSKTATYSATLTAANSGRRLYCVITDAYGNSVTTKTVTMSAADPVSITTQPKNYVGAVGSTATATVAATGDGLSYQWYFANPGAAGFTKSGSKTATYSATLTAANSGRRLYCVITDAYGNSVTTKTVTMSAADPVSITTQPKNYVGAVGSTATATVVASGEGLTYQWYFANPGAAGFTKSGSKTATYSATLTETNSGRRMYCVIKDAYGNSVTTNTVTMTAAANPVSITTQPKNYVGAVGSTATATVTATGDGLIYQWYFANPGATGFTKSGSKTATYSATLTEANSGRRMYCVIKDAYGNTVTTNTVTMSVAANPVSITTQPKNYVGAVGSTATATVVASGEGLTYQWYFANPGATGFTKSGSKTATYSATLTAANSGRRMYCVIKDAYGNSVTTNTVTMTVAANPVSITTQPKNYVGAVGSTATATVKATGEGLTYQWYFANPGATGFTKSGSKTATYSATLTEANSGRRMYCVIKDAYGNSVTSNTVTMSVG